MEDAETSGRGIASPLPHQREQPPHELQHVGDPRVPEPLAPQVRAGWRAERAEEGRNRRNRLTPTARLPTAQRTAVRRSGAGADQLAAWRVATDGRGGRGSVLDLGKHAAG
eukprot:116919-Chlamydomonas_euryale.AAC.3